jgi:hypothetical protein
MGVSWLDCIASMDKVTKRGSPPLQQIESKVSGFPACSMATVFTEISCSQNILYFANMSLKFVCVQHIF